MITVLPAEAEKGEHLECTTCWCDPLVVYAGADGELLLDGPLVIHNERVDPPILKEAPRIIVP